MSIRRCGATESERGHQASQFQATFFQQPELAFAQFAMPQTAKRQAD